MFARLKCSVSRERFRENEGVAAAGFKLCAACCGEGGDVCLGVSSAFEEWCGAVGEGEDAWDAALRGELFGVVGEFKAIASAFVCLLDVEAGDFGAIFRRIFV